jgi:hypothetical protein
VNTLTTNDIVLVAFDYQPGLAGEMQAASASVIDNIMLRGARLVFVSTTPTGPIQAEHYLDTVQSQHTYIRGMDYVNLGYIPGGISGLQAFAQNPQRILPTTLDGKPAWETELLKNLSDIADFSMLLVITDDPNLARGWIEQVQPALDGVPLITVVSAQVEPMVRPYYDSYQAQIDGLISGLTGGASYEVISQPNLARSYWDSFNMTLIVAICSVLIGGVINIITDLNARRKETGAETE